MYPLAKATVDGLRVGENIPNTDSIRASFTDYTVLRGVRKVTLADFNAPWSAWAPRNLFYAADDIERTEALAEEIAWSKRIDPLIVAVDDKGPYILEGVHRLGALYLLKKRSFPALVVIDEDV